MAAGIALTDTKKQVRAKLMTTKIKAKKPKTSQLTNNSYFGYLGLLAGGIHAKN